MATPNGIKASIILEELGLQYKLVPIDISTNVQKEPWFLKINPNGRIPAITDGEQRIFESGAIILYLTDTYDTERKFTFEHGTPEYVEMLSWIMFQMGGVGPMQGQANHFVLYAGVRSDYSQKRYLDETRRLFSVVEDRLRETGNYLVGNKYTIADIVNWSWIQAADSLDIDLAKEFPAVYKWVEEISQRPAVQKGKNTPPRKFSAEKFKEFTEQKKAAIRAMENTDKHP